VPNEVQRVAGGDPSAREPVTLRAWMRQRTHDALPPLSSAISINEPHHHNSPPLRSGTPLIRGAFTLNYTVWIGKNAPRKRGR
jgi:hypothetical protein